MTPMLELLCNNEDVLKVFPCRWAGYRDFFNLTGKTPHPMFDTQIAAMALGKASRSVIRTLSICGWVSSSTRARALPTGRGGRLDKRQIDYAIADVTHLSVIFPMMLEN